MRLAAGRVWLGMSALVGSLASAAGAAAQAEVAAWGNLEGIRVQGELMRFETGVCLLRPDGSEQTRTAKERQRPRYRRDGAIRRVDSSLEGVTVREVVEDLSAGVARIDLTVAADTQGIAAATVFCVDLPLDDFASGEAQPLGAEADRVVELAALEAGQRVSVRAEGCASGEATGRWRSASTSRWIWCCGAPSATAGRSASTLCSCRRDRPGETV